MLLTEYLNKMKEIVDQFLDKALPPDTTYPEVLHQAMRYSVLNGGKRLRPTLVIMFTQAFDGEIAEAVPVGCAIELIHSYSLIHDDLPALDNDDYRRGQLTTHKKYGEAMAILTGDALLTHAFNIITLANIPKEATIQNIIDLSLSAGCLGMVGGQVADIESNTDNRDEKKLMFIHAKKTAEMITCACRLGARIGGVPEEIINSSISEYGMNLGMAFQIIDDILDIEGSKEELGKSIGKDQDQNKLTYPSIYGVEKSKKIAESHLIAAVEELKNVTQFPFLFELTKYVLERKK